MNLQPTPIALFVAQALASLALTGCGGGQGDSNASPAQASPDSMRRAQAAASVDTDFNTRCAQPGVVKCVGFDGSADFSQGSGGQNGAFGSNAGIIPPWGTSDYTRAAPDTAQKSSGASSLRFTIPSLSSADTSGAYFTNFSADLSVQFGANEEFYVQWRQRFSPEFIAAQYAGGGGFKQIIVGTGDQPGKTHSSCSTLELVAFNFGQNGFPVMYNSCSGSTSHGAYDGFYEPFGPYDYKLQNGRSSPHCLYSQKNGSYFAPGGNCFAYVANEWMTFQMRVKVGPRVGDEFRDSIVQLWGAREGQPSELLINWGPYNLSAGSATDNERFGKVWLLPYNTGKSASTAYPTAYTWYDELIVSRQKIADPGVVAAAPSPVPAPSPEPSPAPAPAPATWSRIATEGQSFTTSGAQTVRYGSGSTWIQKQVSGAGQCTNTFFGQDPLYGVVKECQAQASAPSPAPEPAPAPSPAPAPATWSRIAVEWQSFTTSGAQTVRYGSGSTWIQKQVSGAGQCTNTFFGQDPLYGVVKECQVQAPAPAPEPSPAPAPAPSPAPSPTPAPSPAPAPAPTWRQNMAIGEWKQVSGSAMASAPISVRTGPDPSAKVNAWNGFSIDTRNSCVYSAANGGHSDYAGNEVDRICLTDNAPAWTEVRASTASDLVRSNTGYYADGRPTSRHSYYGSVFNELRNRAMVLAGSRWGDGWMTSTFDGFNVANKDWDAARSYPDVPSSFANMQGGSVAEHKSSGDIYVFGNWNVYRWSNVSNTWSARLENTFVYGQSAATAVDTKRQRILLVGGNNNEHAFYDLGSNSVQTVSFTGAASGALSGDGNGMVYVPEMDAYLVRKPTAGATVYRINAQTFAVDILPSSGAGGAVPAAPNGVWTRWLYVPQLQGVAYFPTYGGGYWFLRTH